MKTHWIVKLKNPYNHMKIVVYNDGRVYFDKGALLGNLKSRFMSKIEFYINEYAHYIKRYGYEVQDRTGFIAKFWDSSNKKRTDLAVKGWPFEREFLEILLKPNAYQRMYVDSQEFIELMYSYLETPFSE